MELFDFFIVVNFVLIIFVIVNVEVGSFKGLEIIVFVIFILEIGWMVCKLLLFVYVIGVGGWFWKYWIFSVYVFGFWLDLSI